MAVTEEKTECALKRDRTTFWGILFQWGCCTAFAGVT